MIPSATAARTSSSRSATVVSAPMIDHADELRHQPATEGHARRIHHLDGLGRPRCGTRCSDPPPVGAGVDRDVDRDERDDEQAAERGQRAREDREEVRAEIAHLLHVSRLRATPGSAAAWRRPPGRRRARSSSVTLPCRRRTHCSTRSSASGSWCRSSSHCSVIRGAASAPRPVKPPKIAATSSNVPSQRGTPRFCSQVTPAESVIPNSTPRKARKKTDRATQRSWSVSHTPATTSAARRISGVRQAAVPEVGME